MRKILNKPLMLASMMLDSLFLFVPEKDNVDVVASDVGNLQQKGLGALAISRLRNATAC
jgi:hypothetical protein